MGFSAKHIALAAALACCCSCVDFNAGLGGDLVPSESKYRSFTAEIPIESIMMQFPDSLSGYSNKKIVVGALRDDAYGVTTRSCALTLIPAYDTLDFGKNPVVRSFHFSAALDTISVAESSQKRILQTIHVRSLKPGVPITSSTDLNDVENKMLYGDEDITDGPVVYSGSDSLSFNFSNEFAQKFVDDFNGRNSRDFDSYINDFPGIRLMADAPSGNGGRINMFDVQLGYNTDYGYVEGNYAKLNISATYDEEKGPVDTSFFFYYGGLSHIDVDSLFAKGTTGKYPQYALNITGHQTRSLAGDAGDIIYVEGGGGLKPVIPAEGLCELVTRCITDTLLAHGRSADELKKVLIGRARIFLPYDSPDDYTAVDRLYPEILSPTCRIKTDTTITFAGLTDASSATSNQGDINRSLCRYEPDISYHLQQIVTNGTEENMRKGNYDIWMLPMAYETTTTSTAASDNDMSEYYKYLAYQSYYGDMYGYGGYGYGGYGNYYSNYNSYMLAAMYASGSSTSTSTSATLDKDRFYKAVLNGPGHSGKRPAIKLMFSIPME